MRRRRKYTEDMMGERLKDLARLAGFVDIAKFARAAGIEPGTANKHVQRDSISKSAAQKYINAAKGTGADLDWLLTGRGTAPKLYSQPSALPHKVEIESPTDTRKFDIEASGTVPLWRFTRGPGGTVLIEKTDNAVSSPVELRDQKTAFAVRIWDDANAPWLRRGITVFIDPTQIGADGEWCLLAADAPDITRSLANPRIGILLGTTATGWRIQQGDTRVTLPFSEWPHAWKIVFIRQ